MRKAARNKAVQNRICERLRAERFRRMQAYGDIKDNPWNQKNIAARLGLTYNGLHHREYGKTGIMTIDDWLSWAELLGLDFWQIGWEESRR